jgi:hypothetical protein
MTNSGCYRIFWPIQGRRYAVAAVPFRAQLPPRFGFCYLIGRLGIATIHVCSIVNTIQLSRFGGNITLRDELLAPLSSGPFSCRLPHRVVH